MGEMADLDADAMGDLPDDESTTLEEDGVMEPLRERVARVVCPDWDHEDGACSGCLKKVDAIMAIVAEDREKLVAERDAFKTSRDSWMNDFSALATRMDKLVSTLAKAEAREAALVKMLRDAHDACHSEYMDCPWCSGHIGSGDGGEWHDDTCNYAALAVNERSTP